MVLISTLPLLQGVSAFVPAHLLAALLKAALFVLWVIVLANWVAPIILKWATSTGSREIFLLTIVVLSLGNAILSGIFGFSLRAGGIPGRVGHQ